MRLAQAGFTLIELIIALTILGVLLGIALPSYESFMEASRAAAAKAALLESYSATVNRAALNSRHAVLCPSSNADTCAKTMHWSQGWISFLDENMNRERDPAEALILAAPKLSGKVRLTSTSGRTRIVIQPNGGNAGSNVTFTLCDGRGPQSAETIVLSNEGRLRYGKPTSAGVANTCPT